MTTDLQPEIAAVIEERARRVPDFFFIQIGSNDGITDDPIHPYVVEHRWSGILVEPVRYLFDRLVRNYDGHTGLIFENVAIAETAEPRTLYRLKEDQKGLVSWYEQLGSFHERVVLDHAFHIPGIVKYLTSEVVECLTFSELVTRHQVKKIDLLHLDVEGYDAAIIDSIDLATTRPWMILYEHCHLAADEDEPCIDRLRHHGYQLVRAERDTFAYLE